MRVQEPWGARFHPARAFLFVRGLYLLLTADLWFEMVQHGGRYGAGGFNVAHFAWLDRALPEVTPTLYVGLLLASGFLALSLAIRPSSVALRALLALLYTASWMVSLHDSYQHHYLISWLLAFCAGYPIPSADSAARRDAELVVGWGFPMTAITCGIVYTYTGISKSEPEWRSGHVLRALTRSQEPGSARPGKFDALRDSLLNFGLDDATIWMLLALATMALQWSIALGYFAAIGRDERPSRLRAGVVTLGFLGSIAFHLVAELFRVFEIGLFSYYMLWIATLVLAPSAWVAKLAIPFARAARAVERALDSRPLTFVQSQGLHRPLLLAGALAMLGLGEIVPLPGARWAALASLAFFAAQLALDRAFTDRKLALRAGARVLAVAIAGGLCLVCSRVPFDYYRRTAGELRRMGKTAEALAAYRMAQRHAPAGVSREQTIRELEQELERQRAPR